HLKVITAGETSCISIWIIYTCLLINCPNGPGAISATLSLSSIEVGDIFIGPVICCIVYSLLLLISQAIVIVCRLSYARINRRIQIVTQGAAGKTTCKAGCKTLKPLHPAGSNCEGCACSGNHLPWHVHTKKASGNQACKSTHECPLHDSHKVAAVHCGAGSPCYHSPQHTG